MEFSIDTFKPMYNYVLVKPKVVEPKTKSGILISGGKVTHEIGEVIAVGFGMITPAGDIVPLHIKKGNTVIYARGAGIIIKETVDGEEYLLFKEPEFLGVCSTAEIIKFKK